MPRNAFIAIGLIALIVVLAILLRRKNDGMTRVQRDIAESLERAGALKTQRDSLAELVGHRRFAKKEEEGETGETGEADQAGKPGETGVAGATSVQLAHVEQESQRNDTRVPSTTQPVSDHPGIQREGASVPADRFFTTPAIDGLIPQGKATMFKRGDAVYAYAGVHAPQAEQLRLEWVDDAGTILQSVSIEVQANTGTKGYRIYKYRTFPTAGKYVVKLYNNNGMMIGSSEFEITE